MYSTYLYIILLLFGLTQGRNEIPSKNDIQRTISSINDLGINFKKDLKTDASIFKKNLKETITNKKIEIMKLFDSAVNEVEKLPDHCKENTVSILQTLKTNAVGDFLHCPALLPGLMNIFYVFEMTVELIFDIIATTMNASANIFGCISDFWPWRIVSCWYDDVKDNYDQISEQTKLYRSLLGQFAHNFTHSMELCWDNSSAINDIVTIVTPVYNCAGLNIPEKFLQ